MYEDMENMTPDAGNTLPSHRRSGQSRGADIDSIFKKIDREEILRRISTYPPSERKMWFYLLKSPSNDR